MSSISGPVCATVVTKAWPELMPTVARNSVRPKLRNTMFAGSGMTQLIGPVRRSRPTIKRDDKRSTANAEGDGAHSRQGDRYQAEQHAEHHAEADRDIAELRGRLYRIAE